MTFILNNVPTIKGKMTSYYDSMKKMPKKQMGLCLHREQFNN